MGALGNTPTNLPPGKAPGRTPVSASCRAVCCKNTSGLCTVIKNLSCKMVQVMGQCPVSKVLALHKDLGFIPKTHGKKKMDITSFNWNLIAGETETGRLWPGRIA